MCSCALHSTGFLDSTHNCPNCPNYSFETNTTLENGRKLEDKTTRFAQEKEKKFTKTHPDQNNEKNENPQRDKHSENFDRLMRVAVKASKNVLDSGIPKNITSISITAGHRSYHRNQGNAKTTTATCTTQIPEFTDKQCPSDRIKVNLKDGTESPSLSKHHGSKSLEDLLPELPDHSYSKFVRDWIKTSVSSDATKHGKIPIMRKNSILRNIVSQPVIADKTFSNIASEKNFLLSSSKVYAEKSSQLEKDVK